VKEPITIGCSGVTNQDAQVPLLIKELCGLNLRLVIYKSSGEASLAFERKEVDGRAESYFNLKAVNRSRFITTLDAWPSFCERD